MFAGVGQVFRAVVEVGNRQHLALVADPFDPAHAMAGAAVLVPLRRERAAEAVHDFLHARQRQIVGVYLHRQDDHVHVVEEMQVDVLDAQIDAHPVRTGDANERDVAAPIDADRRFAVAAQGCAGTPLTVKEALHVGQEGDELAVVALLKLRRVAGELVQHFLPRIARADLLERLEVALHLIPGAQRHQLQRPDENLAEVPDDDWVGGFGHRTGCRAEVAAV